jgi:hypothetical protein
MTRHLAAIYLIVALVGLGLALFWPSAAHAVPGEMCRHASECSHGEVCVADSWTSATGHCAVIRVLP